MKTTLHGELPLTIYPTANVSEGGRAELCRVRGFALGQVINVTVWLDVNTGEVLLCSPEGYVGAYRMGDLIAAQVAGQIAREQLLASSQMGEDDDVAQAH